MNKQLKLLLLGLLLPGMFCVAQGHKKDTTFLHFAKNGSLDTIRLGRVEKGKKPAIKSNDSISAAGAIKALKDAFLAKFTNTHTNLTKSKVKAYYCNLWNSATYNRIVNEVECLKIWLSGGTSYDTVHRSLGPFQYMPDSSVLNTLFNNASDPPRLSDTVYAKGVWSVKLEGNNALRSWLIERYNSDLKASAFRNVKMDGSYIEQWNELGSIYEEMKEYKRRIRVDTADLFSNSTNILFDQIEALQTKLDSNAVYQRFKKDTLYKKWLWFTEGYLLANPFAFTTSDKKYNVYWDTARVSKYDAVVERMLDSMRVCCNLKPEDVEAWVKAWQSGSERFRKDLPEYEDAILGIKNFTNLSAATSVFNEVKLPVNTGKKPVVDIITYDAAREYVPAHGLFTFDKKQTTRAIDEDTKSIVVVHNVPGSVIKLALNPAVSSLKDESPAQNSFNSAIAAIGGIKTSLNDLGPLFANTSSIFETPRSIINTIITPDINEVNFSSPKVLRETTIPYASSMRGIPESVKAQKDIYNYIFARASILKSAQLITNSEVLIKKYLSTNRLGGSVDMAIRNYVLTNRLPATISITARTNDNIGTQQLQRLVSKFIEDYNIVADGLNRKDSIEVKITNSSLILEGILSLKDRSLPPDPIKQTTQPPLYHTEVFNIEDVDAPKTIDYTILETTKLGTKDTVKTVAKNRIKIGKKYLFQFSAGIGVTTNEYIANTVSVKDGKITVNENNNKVRAIAGVHIYPWKLFMQSNSFMGFKDKRALSRLSVFVGLGVPDPLKNYYLGISNDLLPGFRLQAGGHFYRNYRYTISNNEIVKENSRIEYAGLYVGFSIEPVSFVNLLRLFSKK